MMRMMPLPQMAVQMTMAMAVTASSQLPVQFCMADPGAGDYRREEAHHTVCTEALEQCCHYEIEQGSCSHTHASIVEGHLLRQPLRHAKPFDRHVSAYESEAGAQESGNLTLGYEVEDECADAGEEQCGTHTQPGDDGDEYGGAKHGKEVLHTQEGELGLAQAQSVVDAHRFCVHII